MRTISYKVGQRAMLALWEEVRRDEGAAFDLRSSHARVLGRRTLRLDRQREGLGA